MVFCRIIPCSGCSHDLVVCGSAEVADSMDLAISGVPDLVLPDYVPFAVLADLADLAIWHAIQLCSQEVQPSNPVNTR